MAPVKITVFTPTNNRAYVIEGLYRSLLRLTVSGFVLRGRIPINAERLF